MPLVVSLDDGQPHELSSFRYDLNEMLPYFPENSISSDEQIKLKVFKKILKK